MSASPLGPRDLFWGDLYLYLLHVCVLHMTTIRQGADKRCGVMTGGRHLIAWSVGPVQKISDLLVAVSLTGVCLCVCDVTRLALLSSVL